MTKADKVSEKALREIYDQVLLTSKKHVACHPEVLVTTMLVTTVIVLAGTVYKTVEVVVVAAPRKSLTGVFVAI